MKNRGNKILELLTKDNKIEVSHLAEELGVSQVTMRKDLDTLESKGVIKREHGFALLCSTDDINGRIAYHYEEKRKIAQKAAGLVSNGDTIMIENGSCCALLADTLTTTKKDLTIITNSAFIAEYIRGKFPFSPLYLNDLFCSETGMTLPEYIRTLRVELIKREVCHSNKPFVKIASEMGFSSLQALEYTFQKLTGYSLGAYRRASICVN